MFLHYHETPNMNEKSKLEMVWHIG